MSATEHIPFFSIVMPVYNREDLVGTAIRSVLEQSYGNWELVVIDDGSTDRTAKVIRGFSDARIKYHYQENQERSRSRNNGIDKAKGLFICFLDSDDYYLPHHLEVLHRFIEQHGLRPGLYATGAHVDRGKGMEKLGIYLDTSIHPVKHIFYHKLDMNTTCVHRSILANEKFDPSLRIGEDTHLWLRIVKNHPFFQVPEYTTVTVNHAQSGMVMYYRDADLKLLKEYVKGARMLFRTLDLSEYIARKEQHYYISKKYRSMARSCIWARKPGGILRCTLKAVYWTPSFIFTREFLNIVKESLYMTARIILRKPNPVSL